MTDVKTAPPSSTVNGPPGGTVPRPLDRLVFGVAATLALLFLVYGSVATESFTAGTGSALEWITANLGWLFVLASAGFVIFSLFLAISRYGNIRLGPDHAQPEFSTFSWVSMMFATGMGIA